MRHGKFASGVEYRMDKQFPNLLIFEIFYCFLNWKNSENFFIFEIVKFWKIPKISTLENSKNF